MLMFPYSNSECPFLLNDRLLHVKSAVPGGRCVLLEYFYLLFAEVECLKCLTILHPIETALETLC